MNAMELFGEISNVMSILPDFSAMQEMMPEMEASIVAGITWTIRIRC